MSKILDFSELLVTKMCHDLAGSVGAVDNGVEFLQDMASEETRSKALELLSTTSFEMVAKLKFFRYLYGMSSSSGESDMSEVKNLVSNFYKGEKHKFTWKQGASESGIVQLTSRAAKLLCNLIYLVSEAMITAGEVEVSLTLNNGIKELVIDAKCDKFKEIKAITQILDSHEQRDISLENVQIHLTAKIATSLGVIIHCAHKKNELKISISF